MYLLIAMSVFAWRENIADCPKIMVGRDSAGNEVHAHFMNFLKEVDKPGGQDEEFHFAVVKNSPFLAITYKQEFALYDYVTGKLKTKINLPKNAKFEDVTKDGIVISNYNPMRVIETNTLHFYNFDGQKLWEAKKTPDYFTTCQDVVVAASHIRLLNDNKYTWRGLDIKTGDKLWEKMVKSGNHFHRSCYHIPRQDSTKMYIIADSLLRIDLITGESISHRFNVGEEELLLNLFTTTPILMGHPADTIYDPNLIMDNWYSSFIPFTLTGSHSNWIEKGDTLFIADAKKIYAFNKDLKPYWTTLVPDMKGGKSAIRLVGDKLLLFNYGVGFHRANPQNAGVPMAASLSIVDGQLLSTTNPNAKDHMIGGYYTDSGRLYWLTRRKLFYCDEGDSKLREIKWKSRAKYYSVDQRLQYSIQDTVWVKGSKGLEPVATDDNQVVVVDWGKQVHVMRLDGSEEIIPSKEAYFRDAVHDSYHTAQQTDDQPVYSVLGTYSKIDNERLHRGRVLMVDPVTHQISHDIHTSTLYSRDNGHLLIDMRDGIGFVNLNNCSESN